MTDDRQQLPLFASWTSSSTSAAPSSPPSNAPGTSSSAPARSTAIAAIAITPTPPVTDRSTLVGVVAAARSARGAISTVASAAPATLPMFTARNTADRMLSVPRPTTRAECELEARPCPWVGCRHHLLLEVAKAKPRAGRDARPTSIRLNMAARDRTKLGRRAGLASSAAAGVVRLWIDEAVELLSRMRYTCALDVARDYPDGIADHGVAQLLGVHEQAVAMETRDAKAAHARGLRGLGIDSEEG